MYFSPSLSTWWSVGPGPWPKQVHAGVRDPWQPPKERPLHAGVQGPAELLHLRGQEDSEGQPLERTECCTYPSAAEGRKALGPVLMAPRVQHLKPLKLFWPTGPETC